MLEGVHALSPPMQICVVECGHADSLFVVLLSGKHRSITLTETFVCLYWHKEIWSVSYRPPSFSLSLILALCLCSVRIRDSTLLCLFAGATEIVAVYFEDPCVRPGIINLAVRKGVWPYMQKYVAALHDRTTPASTPGGSSEVRCTIDLIVSSL